MSGLMAQREHREALGKSRKNTVWLRVSLGRAGKLVLFSWHNVVNVSCDLLNRWEEPLLTVILHLAKDVPGTPKGQGEGTRGSGPGSRTQMGELIGPGDQEP